MTDKRMALVPRTATEKMNREAIHSPVTTEDQAASDYTVMLAAAPHSGKVSREQLEVAISSVLVVIFDDTRTNTDPDANATDATIAVITSLGLEIEE